jgi:hypothetical protein
VVKYDASSVPVLQLSLKSDRLNEQQLYDYGLYNLRQQLARSQASRFQPRTAASTGRSWWILIR